MMRRVDELKAPYPAGGAVPRDDHVRRSQRSRHQRQMTTPTSDDDSNVICTSLIPTIIALPTTLRLLLLFPYLRPFLRPLLLLLSMLLTLQLSLVLMPPQGCSPAFRKP